MIILGIESSCDETGISIFCTKRNTILSNIIHSQASIHDAYGGVVPEIASRDHMVQMIPLIKKSLDDCLLKITDIDIVAYTSGPGLSGSLLVGSSIANSIAWSLDLPIIKINHLEGHILSPLLNNPELDFPFISLLVSGGHTQLISVNDIGNYKTIGDTLDDAAGEAFDKIAKLIGLPYPGGPEIAELAKIGNDKCYILPRPLIHSNNLDFSFSGLKTAVLLKIKHLIKNKIWNQDSIKNMAASVQSAIVDVLVYKSLKSLQATNISKLALAGGVSSNQLLRDKLSALTLKNKYKVYFPSKEMCTDNGAMIAFAAALRLKHNLVNLSECKVYDVSVKPKFKIEEVNYS